MPDTPQPEAPEMPPLDPAALEGAAGRSGGAMTAPAGWKRGRKGREGQPSDAPSRSRPVVERGVPERRRRRSKETERDLLPAPAWPRPDHRLLLEAEGALGYVLWQRARDVRLWASFRDAAPKGLFRPLTPQRQRLSAEAAREAPEIVEALSTLDALVSAPEKAAPGPVGAACAQISAWGEERSRFEIALTFAEAAAAAEPYSARAAATAGQLCTHVQADPAGEAMEARAVTWLHRAARLARRGRDWEWYIRAHIRLGRLTYILGNYSRARRLYNRAGWMADWFGRRELAGKAHHDLAAIESHVGPYAAAERHARKALKLYPVHHPRLPYLVHDYGFALMRNCYHAVALQLLEAAWNHIPPDNRLVINGTLARVSGGLRDRLRYEQAASRAVLLAELSEYGAAWAYIHLAEGARCFGEWDRAEAYAGVGLAMAQRRREMDAQRVAYDLLDAITTRTPAPAAREAPQSATEMAALCLERLRKLREGPEGREEAVPASRVVTTAWAP